MKQKPPSDPVSVPDASSHPAPLRRFKGRIQVNSGKPIEISESKELTAKEPSETDDERAEIRVVAETLTQYRRAAKELLSGKYRELAALAPPHLRAECDCWIVMGADGIIVRWDKHQGDDKAKMSLAWPQEGPITMEALAPGFSERFVYCVTDISSFKLPPDGQKLQLSIGDVATGESRIAAEMGVAAIVNWAEVQKQPPQQANRPIPIVSIGNELDVDLGGEEFDASAEPKVGTGQPFVVASHLKLAVGWEAFEIYPPFDKAVWRPEAAADWAELDLLAASARRNVRQEQLNAIDPRAAARREYANRLKEFRSLLDGPEAPLQEFLENNPQLLTPTYLRMWKKVPLGKRVTDFIFKEPTDYILVELEAPARQLFRKDGQQSEELTHAVDQVHDWLRYIQDNPDTVRRELGLEGISAHPSCLIVIGRSASLTDSDKRKLVTMQGTSPKFRILTYDDVLVAATQSITNLLGTIPITQGDVEVYYQWDKK